MTLSRGESSLLAWFAGNPVAANLLMLLIVFCGTVSVEHTVKQAYPRFAPVQIAVEAKYPGAGPAEVESSVCIPIEEAVHDLDGIKRLSTNAIDGDCKIAVFVEQDFPIRDLTNALRSRIQAIKTLPQAVERVDIDDSGWEYPAISVVLYGDTDQLTLRHLAEQVRDDLENLPGVRKTMIWGNIEYEIAVEISPELLRQQQLTLSDVAAAIRKASLDIPGGVVKAATGEFQLRAKNTAYDREKLLGLILRTDPDGTRLRLGDIATVTDGFADQAFEMFSEGKFSETIAVLAERDLVETATTVRDYVAELAPRLPEGIQAITRRDNARSFSELFDTLIGEGVTGFFLVMLILMLFMSTSTALWAAMGVLIAVFGALWWMPIFDVSLNMLSLFGFVLAMGILVDDAIIVSDRVQDAQDHGMPGLAGAVFGIRDVAVPVALGVIISLIAFMPGLFVPPSWATRFMKPVAVVMMLSLAFSLVEALLILPAHLAGNARSGAKSGRLEKLRASVNGALRRFVSSVYEPLLRKVITWRYLTLAGFIAVIVFGLTLALGEYIKISLEEDVGYDNFHIHLQPPPGTPYREIQARVQQFIDALKTAEGELNALQPDGSPSVIEGLDIIMNEVDPQIYVEFSSQARKQFHIRELIDRWYSHVGDVGDFHPDFHTPTEQEVVDLELEVSAADPAQLDAALLAIESKLTGYAGVHEIQESRLPGKPEIRFLLSENSERLGLRLKDLADQVRHAYYGEEAQRFIRGRDEIKIMLRYPRAYRESIQDLKTLPITLPDGGQAPLGTLAEIQFAPGFGALKRENRLGTVALHVRLTDDSPLNGEAIFEDLEREFFPALANRYPSLEISAGEAKEEADLVGESLKQNTLISLVVIYALIAVSFRSYLQPLLFMLSVPVAWVGAISIHWVLDLKMSFQSVIGMVAASGVVVNDSVVLLDFIRKRLRDEKPLAKIIVEACSSRFRPIMLVALTTLAGFFPMLFLTSEQANFLVPMVLALTFGLLFGVAATLILTPACYAILQDISDLGAARQARRADRLQQQESAQSRSLK